MKLLIKVLLGCCVGWVYFVEGEIPEAFHISAQQSCSGGSLEAWEGYRWVWDFSWRRRLFVSKGNLVTELLKVFITRRGTW